MVIKVQGDLSTRLNFQINGQSYSATIEELMAYGYTNHMEYYHSHAFKIHKAIPESRYTFQIDVNDCDPEKDCDFYHLEVAQNNRQWAFVSPVYVERRR